MDLQHQLVVYGYLERALSDQTVKYLKYIGMGDTYSLTGFRIEGQFFRFHSSPTTSGMSIGMGIGMGIGIYLPLEIYNKSDKELEEGAQRYKEYNAKRRRESHCEHCGQFKINHVFIQHEIVWFD